MMKTTQILTNTKLWQNILVAFMFLFSFSINSQNVGDDLMATTNGALDTSNNSGQGTGCLPGGAAYDGSTACGWTQGVGVNYAPSNGQHGDVHSGDRMWKFNAGNGVDGDGNANAQLVAQEFSQLPLGTYTLTFFHKWTNGGGMTYANGAAPKLSLKISDGAGGWTNVSEVDVPEGNVGSGAAWTEMSTTYEITEVNDYKMQIFKAGGSAANPTDMYGSLHLDTFSFTYDAAAATSDCDFSISLTDAYGDGWGDNSVDVLVDGVVVLDDLTLANGYGPESATFGVSEGSTLDFVYDHVDTSWGGENSYQVFDNLGNLVFDAQGGGTGFGDPPPPNGSITAACADPAAIAMGVTATTNGGSATFTFDISNFTVGATGSGADGHIHYSLNGGATVMVYSSDPLTLDNLPNGDHSIVFTLVDDSHQPIDPAIEATVAFSTFDGTANCDETITYTQTDSTTYSVTVTDPNGGNVSVTVNGDIEVQWDNMVITDSAGNVLNTQVDGIFTDYVVESDSSLTITVTNDGSVSNGDLTFAFSCAPAGYSVTFSVDMSNYIGGLAATDIVYVNGTFNGWCGACTPMSDDDGDGIWTVTVPGFVDGFYKYKFTVNGWDTQEEFGAIGAVDGCTFEDGGFVDRYFDVAGADLVLETVFWNLCPGETPGNTYSVTFEVNTASIIGGVGPNGLYLGGGIFGNAQAHEMFDADGDGVYSVTVEVNEGTSGAYIFLNSPADGGDWGTVEDLAGQDCAYGQYNDRFLEPVNADTTLITCFGFCSGNGTGDCPAVGNTYTLSFELHTCDLEVGANGMFVGGGVIGGANALALSDDDGDGVWTGSLVVEEGLTGNYTYVNSPNDSGDYANKENIGGQACADGQWDDRLLAPVTEDTTLVEVFGYCAGTGTGECPTPDAALSMQGIIDFTLVSGGSTGKAMHFYVNEDIADLSIYTVQVYPNGNDTPQSTDYTFPAEAATAGDHILLARDVDAMSAYLGAENFTTVYAGGSFPTMNGNDAVELLSNGQSTEVYGVIGEDPDTNGGGCNGDPNCWDTEDGWAYKVNGEWTYSEVNCTDAFEDVDGDGGLDIPTSTCDSQCPYPFITCPVDLYAAGGFRYQYEVAGYRGVGPGGSMGPDWWSASAYQDFNNAAWPNESGVNNGLADDIMYFYADGTFTYDTGEDGSIMGKKPEIDAAFDPDGSNAYDADTNFGENNNEYFNYPLDDFSDTFTLGNDGTYDTIEFATVGALGFYTSTGAQVYQILSTTSSTMYVRNVGSEGNSWYSMLTTDEHALSTSDVDQVLDMMIYPNPVDGNYVTILSPVQGLKEIQVFGVTGRKLMETTINGSTLDVSSLNSGFYLINVTINGQSKVSKLVVR